MQVAVLVEPILGKGYRASSEAFSVSVEGATEEEAIERIEQVLQDRLASGSRLVTVNVPKGSHPSSQFFGKLQLEPLFDEWVAAMDERRNAIDEDENEL